MGKQMLQPSGGYHPRPKQPGYWSYAGLPVMAAVETHRFVVEHAQPGERAIDIAAGQGALTQALLDKGVHVSATTWDDALKAVAPSSRLNLDHPFGPKDVSGSYDLVAAIEIIEHVENPAEFLRSCASVLKAEGRIILSTPNVTSVQARLQWLRHGVPGPFSTEEIRRNRHISLLWPEGLEFLIHAAGLRIEARHVLGTPRLGGPLRAFLKRAVYVLLGKLLKTTPWGTAHVYVLRHGQQGRMPGAGEVW
jgi:SAM-dependent methyltransferase